MISRYDLMRKFEAEGIGGRKYKNIYSYPNDKGFLEESTNLKLVITEREQNRIDLTMMQYYSSSEFDDIILWANNVIAIKDTVAGDVIDMPDDFSLNSFYEQHLNRQE